MALSAKNKLCFIDGSLSKPDEGNPIFLAWKRCNHMVISWLLNSISKELVASVLYIDTAAAIWSDLKERFSQTNGPCIFQLRKAITSLTQNQCSVSAYSLN